VRRTTTNQQTERKTKMPRLQITPEEFKRAKMVRPGWFPSLIKEVTLELSKDKQSHNIVLDLENADNESEFIGVPAKHWLTEKYIQGVVSFVKAFDPDIPEDRIADIEFSDYKGKYIYAKWGTNRGKDGTDPPRNNIEDWAPLPSKWTHLNKTKDESVTSSVTTFEKV